MFVDVNKLKDNCPKELEEEIEDIIFLSRKFLNRLDIHPNQYLEEVKVDVQEAKDYLFQILSRLMTLIADNYPESTTLKDFGLRLKFEEDVGSIIGELKEKHAGRFEKLIQLSALLRFAGELRTTYDFLIYHPIINANKNSKKNLIDYMGIIFKTIRTNASILGYSSKPITMLSPSKQILPRPTQMIVEMGKEIEGKKEDESIGKELKDLVSGMNPNEEEPSDEEEGMDEEEEEQK